AHAFEGLGIGLHVHELARRRVPLRPGSGEFVGDLRPRLDGAGAAIVSGCFVLSHGLASDCRSLGAGWDALGGESPAMQQHYRPGLGAILWRLTCNYSPTACSTMRRSCGRARCSNRNSPCHVPSASSPPMMGMPMDVCVSAVLT